MTLNLSAEITSVPTMPSCCCAWVQASQTGTLPTELQATVHVIHFQRFKTWDLFIVCIFFFNFIFCFTLLGIVRYRYACICGLGWLQIHRDPSASAGLCHYVWHFTLSLVMCTWACTWVQVAEVARRRHWIPMSHPMWMVQTNSRSL